MNSNKLYIGTTISRSSELSTSALFILLMQLVNGVQFLKTTSLLFLSSTIASASVPCPTTVIIPSTSIYASI